MNIITRSRGVQTIDFLSLPVVMIENVFSYLPYDEIAKKRLVSKFFNDICMKMLNRGFLMIERRHALALKNVKMQLPRRESERRYHHLSRHCDILTSIETRISMLNMTYSKFIDNRLCCFIPGKVIDEIRRVLTIVETSETPPRAHEVLQELRDISSMAIEHFDDKISPAFRKKLQEGAVQPSARASHGGVLGPIAISQEIAHLRKRTVLNAKLSLYMAAQYKRFYNRMVDYKKLIQKQHRTIRYMSRRQRYQENAIADLKKRIEECDIKYSELTHTNQAAGGKAKSATSSGEVTQSSSQPLRHFSSQIKLDLSVLPIGTSKRNQKLIPNMKPRKPLIRLPSLSEDSGPPPKQQNTNDNRLDNDPSTSSDNESPKTKSQSTREKIEGLATELRQLSNLTKGYDGKTKRTNIDVTVPDRKKQKID